MWFGCRVLRHDTNSVQKTYHQMLQFGECNCLGDLCSLLSWQPWSRLADIGGQPWGLTWWWIQGGANNWFCYLLWAQARAIADNCWWCWHWFNSGLVGKWSDRETSLVARISGGTIYIHWWMIRIGERGSSSGWGSGSDGSDWSSGGDPIIVRWHIQVIIGDSTKSWESMFALCRGTRVDCLEVIPVFPAWCLESIYKLPPDVCRLLYNHLVYERE